MTVLVGELASQFSVIQHQIDDPFLVSCNNLLSITLFFPLPRRILSKIKTYTGKVHKQSYVSVYSVCSLCRKVVVRVCEITEELYHQFLSKAAGTHTHFVSWLYCIATVYPVYTTVATSISVFTSLYVCVYRYR